MAAAKTTEARRSRWRGLLPVLAAALACFLVVLALLTARVAGGRDPALQASSSRAVVLARGGRRVLRTTASGRPIAPSAGEAGAGPAAAPVTRSSAAAQGSERDG